MIWLIDIIAVAVIVLFLVMGYKKGFVRICVTAAGFVLGSMLALAVAAPVSTLAYTVFVEEKVIATVEESIKENAAGEEIAESVFDNGLVSAGMSAAGVSRQEFASKIDSVASTGGSQLVGDICERTIEPVVTKLLETVIFLVLMLLLTIAVRLAARVINKAFSFSLVGKVNSLLGALLGAMEGAGVLLLVSAVLPILFSLAGGSLGPIDETLIEQTHVFKAFYAMI